MFFVIIWVDGQILLFKKESFHCLILGCTCILNLHGIKCLYITPTTPFYVLFNINWLKNCGCWLEIPISPLSNNLSMWLSSNFLSWLDICKWGDSCENKKKCSLKVLLPYLSQNLPRRTLFICNKSTVIWLLTSSCLLFIVLNLWEWFF